MDQLTKAKVQFSLVAVVAGVLVAFSIWLAVIEHLHPAVILPVAAYAGVQCLPLALWSTRWRKTAADVTAVTASIMVIASLVILGPIFFLPAALLAIDGARRLEGYPTPQPREEIVGASTKLTS